MTRDLANYDQQYHTLPFEETQVRYRKRKILESLAKYRPQTVLEVGCGLDPIFNHYPNFPDCVIVEPAEAFYQNAVVQSIGRPHISVVQGTLEDRVDALVAKRFDFIILSSLLHEIADSSRLLAGISRLCGTETVLHVNVPNSMSLHRLLALEMGLISEVHESSAVQKRMQQSHTFDPDSLSALLNRSGFDVIEEGTFFIKPFTHAQMADLYASGFMSERMLDGLYGLSKHFPKHGSEIFMNLRRRR